MRKKRTPRLKRWTDQVTSLSALIRALTILSNDLRMLVGQSRRLVISFTGLVLTIVVASKTLF